MALGKLLGGLAGAIGGVLKKKASSSSSSSGRGSSSSSSYSSGGGGGGGSYSILDYQNEYKKAQAAGDADRMQWANDGANTIRRSQGQQEQHANVAIGNARNNAGSYLNRNNSSPALSAIDRMNKNLNRGDSYVSDYGSVGVLSNPNLSTDGSWNDFNFSELTRNALQGKGTGVTGKDMGFTEHYAATLNQLQNKLNVAAQSGNQRMAEHYATRIKEFESANSNMNLMQNTFAGWDTGLIRQYGYNKRDWQILNMTPENSGYSLEEIKKMQSQVSRSKEELEAINRELREFYGMEEDNLTWDSDLGRVISDLDAQQFVQYGLEKFDPNEELKDGQVYNKYQMAEMIGRENNLMGYKPYGQVTAVNGMPVDYGVHHEERLIQEQEVRNKINEAIKDKGIGMVSDISDVVDLGGGAEIYQTDKGRFAEINGKMTEISEEEYTDIMLDSLGIQKITPVDAVNIEELQEKYAKMFPRMDFAGFEQVTSAAAGTPTASSGGGGVRLGSVSGKYESSGSPGTVSSGKGDYGGVSYGIYQFSTNTGGAKSFLNFLKTADPAVYKELNSSGNPGSAGFGAAWKRIANRDGDKFAALQQKAVQTRSYDPVVATLKKDISLDVNNRSHALQEAIWSTAVQHGVGGGPKVIKRAVQNAGGVGASDRALISAIYDERGANNGAKYFKSSSKAVQQSVANRFKKEKQDILKLLR